MNAGGDLTTSPPRPMEDLHDEESPGQALDEEVLRKILQHRVGAITTCSSVTSSTLHHGDPCTMTKAEKGGKSNVEDEGRVQKRGHPDKKDDKLKGTTGTCPTSLGLSLDHPDPRADERIHSFAMPRSIPGAHAVAGGAASTQVMMPDLEAAASSSIVSDATADDANTASLSETTPGSSSCTEPVANAVELLDDLPVAEEMILPRRSSSDHGDAASTKALTRLCGDKRNLMFAWLLLLVALCGVVVVAVVVSSLAVGDDSGGPPKAAAPWNATSHVLALLPQYTIDTIHHDSKSPQALAFDWLLQDPLLETYPDWRLLQRYALATMFYSTGGHHGSWNDSDNWLSYEEHECQWYAKPKIGEFSHMVPMGRQRGRNLFQKNSMMTALFALFKTPFPCEDNPDGVYRHFWQWANGLDGTIPPEVALLTSLRTISAYRNPSLTGSLPSTMGLLTDMVGIHLGLNDLVGTIPTELGNGMTNLLFLFLSGNQLKGTLPSEMGLLSQLHLFQLEDNQLIGSLPSELGQQTSLGWMHLGDNAFTGTIPSQIGKLQQLSTLDLAVNQLSGALPSELGYLTQLGTLDLQVNQLSSSIPSELGALERLQFLSLHSNDLTGSPPEELGQLVPSSLEELGLENNPFLSGVIPSSLCATKLLTFDCTGTLCGCNCTC